MQKANEWGQPEPKTKPKSIIPLPLPKLPFLLCVCAIKDDDVTLIHGLTWAKSKTDGAGEFRSDTA